MNELPEKQKIIVEKIDKLPPRYLYRAIKRLFDIVFSLIAIVLLIIPMIIFGLIIKFDGGPALFKQRRLGLNGRGFVMYKLRTMRVDAESNGAKWAEKNDPRITKIGRFLRRLQIDEWPQFFNVLFGSMTFVGPRPEVKVLHDQFCQYVIGFEQRLLIKPGLTGLAQINGGFLLKPEEKIVFDIRYIKKQSIWLDILILLKTLAVIVNGHGYPSNGKSDK